MGYYVHISVIFAYDRDDSVTDLAERYLEKGTDSREIKSFLEHLRDKRSPSFTPKGGTFYWGGIGNYTVPEEFIVGLNPFWVDLLTANGSPLDFEHILVFYEREQHEAASAYEIFLDPEKFEEGENVLVVKHHERLPFAWMQF